MKIALVRHAEAEDFRIETMTGDAERRLTKNGKKIMRRSAKGLRRLLGESPHCVATSPYIRAIQTAKIVAKAYRKKERPDLQVVDVLAAGAKPPEVAKWLRAQPPDALCVLVGHEPDMSLLLAYLTTNSNNQIAKFSKSAACLMECATAPGKNKCQLTWFATPLLLKKIGK